jgi:putative MATE family efflux protein
MGLHYCINHLYDKNKIDWNHLMFSNLDLRKLLVPLIIENLLTSFMGMADSMMVTRVGSAAISAVSLTDSINNLVIQLFSAMATGGTIICSQYIGSSDLKRSNDAARQIVLAVTSIALFVAVVAELFHLSILHLVFGKVDDDVMQAAAIYFRYTAASFPFLALYQVGAAFFRAGGNSRFPMKISVLSNLLNIAGNAFFIFALGMGVGGAALSTLISRAFSAIVLFIFLRLPRQPIVIQHILGIRPDFAMIGRVLSIGIPSGIENSMFQFGKLAIQSSVSTLGTTAIAAQAMTIIFENVNGIAGIAVGMGLMTVIGQTLGAGRKEEAKYYMIKLIRCGYMVILVSCLLTCLVSRPVMFLAGMEPAAAALCWKMLLFITIVKPIIWVPSFISAYGFRAAGDVRFTMIIASISMWALRVVIVIFLIRYMGFGPIAVWIGMAMDWLFRAVVFTTHFLKGKWLRYTVI